MQPDDRAPAAKRVSIGSLPIKAQKRLADQITDPEQQSQVVDYIAAQERKTSAARKKKRRTSKLARKRNRTR